MPLFFWERKDRTKAFYALRVTFQPFGLVHAVTFVCCAAVLACCAWVGKRGWMRDGRRVGEHVHRARRMMLWATVVIQASNLVFWALPANLDPASSLPLHLCDVAGLIAIATLAMPAIRMLGVLLWCWGVGLSTQAFITPVITEGPDSFRFWIFFVSHLSIVGVSLFTVFSGLLRPRASDVFPAFGITALYGFAMIVLNMQTGWNYVYVGNTQPINPTVIDKLGPWPLRLVWLGLIVLGIFTAILVPWGNERGSREKV